jgi:hypothetical protein
VWTPTWRRRANSSYMIASISSSESWCDHLELWLLGAGVDCDVAAAATAKKGDLQQRCWLRTPLLGSMIAPLGPQAFLCR